MNNKISKLRTPSILLMTLILSTIMLLASSIAFAATTHHITLTAKSLPNGQLAYALGGADAVIPGPTLFIELGDTVEITVDDTTGTSVGIDVPGQVVGQAGTVFTVTPNKTGSHVYHGNNGKEMLGLFGAIVVNEVGGGAERFVDDDGTLVPVTQGGNLDKQFVMFMVGATFWGAEISGDGSAQTPLWANPTLGAEEGDIVRFHVLSVGPAHTFHMHAHRWLKEGTDKIIDTKLLAEGADSHSFTIKAGAGVGEGAWQFHCHLISHMEAGMHGTFVVGDGISYAGASPYGNILLGATDDPGLVTFEISDEPGSWFRSARGDALVDLSVGGNPLNIKTKSLEVIAPNSSVNFVMSDTNAVHTITTLLWPTGAEHMPFDQTKAFKGGAILKLEEPGLYVFTCKVHPYMFGAVIVDSDQSTLNGGLDGVLTGLDLGDHISLVTGISIPTNTDLAVRLLRTFFVATAPDNWQDYTSGNWTVTFPDILTVNVKDIPGLPLNALNIDMTLPAPMMSAGASGIGEVWINTQFESTANKSKPGTITVVNAADWSIKRKIALPAQNMNHPHNMWTDKTNETIYQTQWFDNKLTLINRADGAWIRDIQVGNSPSHVMTLPDTDDITVAINGENGIAFIPENDPTEVSEIIPTQPAGHTSANPHGHWISADGSKIVTPNINTGDAGVYNAATGDISSRTATGGNFPSGPHPIAIGMNTERIYVTNLLDHSINVINLSDGSLIKTINLIAAYGATNPFDFDDQDQGASLSGILPIQTPVDPTGRVVVTANTGGTITIIDTLLNDGEVVAVFPCDPGCHGVNFGAKAGGGYYAYVSSKFSNRLIVVDIDLDNPANSSIAGTISLADAAAPTDDAVVGLAGTGGQGVLAIPNVYNGWVQNVTPVGGSDVEGWVNSLEDDHKNPTQVEF